MALFELLAHAPLTVLTVPGLCCSGPDHWQSRWERRFEACRRAELPDWEDPSPAEWIDGLDRAVARLPGTAIFAAHSLGCYAVAGWAAKAKPSALRRIRGALLVAPPDTDRANGDVRVARFSGTRGALPFPSLLVASRDDEWSSFDSSRRTAATLGAELIDAGVLGHINADSGLGDWDEGLRLLARFTKVARP